jgi:hypothetical protein
MTHSDRLSKSAAWPYLIIAILAVTFLALAYLIPPGADTLWRLHIADGILDGKVLYRDFIEVNPPLWFWGALPAALLGGYPALVGINLVASFLAIGLLGALTSQTLTRADRRGAMLGLAAALFLLNVAEIGQREQAFLVACVLWGAIVAARVERKALPLWLCAAAAILSAYGFALKHYFVVVPIVCELYLLASLKRNWRPIRTETLIVSALAIGYAIAVVTLTPDFLGRVLSLVQASYDGFGPGNVIKPEVLATRIIRLGAFTIAPVIALLVTRDKSPFLRLMTLACLCATAIILVQEKYWRYHMIAANGLALLVVFLAWYRILGRKSKGILGWTATLTLPLGVAGLLWLGSVAPTLGNLRTHGQPIVPALKTLIDAQPSASHIAILSIAPDNAFYPLARAGRPHWSRHFSMWMMPGLYAVQATEAGGAARLRERQRVLEEFTADLMCQPPNLIIGEVGYFRDAARTRFDAMAFLREDPAFNRWISAHYTAPTGESRYPVWRLTGPKPTPSHCTGTSVRSSAL